MSFPQQVERRGRLGLRLQEESALPMHKQPGSLFPGSLVNKAVCCPGWTTDSRRFPATGEAAEGLPGSFGDFNPEFMRPA